MITRKKAKEKIVKILTSHDKSGTAGLKTKQLRLAMESSGAKVSLSTVKRSVRELKNEGTLEYDEKTYLWTIRKAHDLTPQPKPKEENKKQKNIYQQTIESIKFIASKDHQVKVIEHRPDMNKDNRVKVNTEKAYVIDTEIAMRDYIDRLNTMDRQGYKLIRNIEVIQLEDQLIAEEEIPEVEKAKTVFLNVMDAAIAYIRQGYSVQLEKKADKQEPFEFTFHTMKDLREFWKDHIKREDWCDIVLKRHFTAVDEPRKSKVLTIKSAKDTGHEEAEAAVAAAHREIKKQKNIKLSVRTKFPPRFGMQPYQFLCSLPNDHIHVIRRRIKKLWPYLSERYIDSLFKKYKDEQIKSFQQLP